jgi:chromosome segregation protein
MGTGLGPRAYAIIGQGMISRIIEAKPEELRVFLEEAAGVSKYKERRRETENRLNDTRDNLTRVEDILRELNNQVEKLDAQAKVAQEYRDLQNSAQDKLHFLWVLRYDEAQAERDKINANIQLAHNELEAQMAKLRHIEAELESKRSQHYEFSDALNLAQASMYEANAEVSRIETELRFMTFGRDQYRALNQLLAQSIRIVQGIRNVHMTQPIGQQLTQRGIIGFN